MANRIPFAQFICVQGFNYIAMTGKILVILRSRMDVMAWWILLSLSKRLCKFKCRELPEQAQAGNNGQYRIHRKNICVMTHKYFGVQAPVSDHVDAVAMVCQVVRYKDSGNSAVTTVEIFWQNS